jgi:16S rRNA (cytosine967-C5)-methyltransferase
LEDDPRGHLEHALSLPRWLAERWLSLYGPEEAAALGRGMLEQAPTTLRVNTLRTSREAYLAALAACGHEAVATRFSPEGITIRQRSDQPLPGDAEGSYQVQDEASQLIAHLLQPQAGEIILDACAAPGGKTTHIAALTDNRAEIVAADLHPHRLELLRFGAKRLGCTGISIRPADLTRNPEFLQAQSCDRILVDAPCSGLGVLRRNPELRWRRRPEDLVKLAQLQRTILANVAPLVRPGGVLLYSVCTITPEETDAVVDAFLADHPQFDREDLRKEMPEDWLTLFDDQGALRTFPHRHGGMDGFYAMRMKRKS